MTMGRAWLLVLLLLLVFWTDVRHGQELHGRSHMKPSCEACIKSPGCAWCKQKGFLMPGESREQRCDSPDALRARNCSTINMINPQPETVIVKDNQIGRDPENVVQLRPQELHFRLRTGVPHTFNVVFKRAENYPIDLYCLMDLSFSMKDDLENFRKLGQKIVTTLKNFTDDVRIGFGAFVDKVALPFVSTMPDKMSNPCSSMTCQPPFSFKNVLKLTDDAKEFERRVSQENISANLDDPEAGFDAILQAAVCQDEIGWRNVTRILVYTSDDIFHTAGDGKLSGIYLPNDGKCHLNREGFYEKSTHFDYPSVDQLSQVLAESKIHLIFAVTEKNLYSYNALSKVIPHSVVGLLKDDSSNVVQLISEAYRNLTSTVVLEHQGAPPGLHVSYSSHCSEGNRTQGQPRGECHNVMINQQVNFTVTLGTSSCLTGNKSFVMKVQGINEELKISVETICDCECTDGEEQSHHCSHHGTLSCGICRCNEGYTGERCECERQQDEVFPGDACRQSNASLMCSGHGSCVCGHCACRGFHRGEFCQCDDTSCNRHNNLICSGRGTCKCGVCQCQANYTGSACECSVFRNHCETGSSGECSGHGHCECNRCRCQTGFSGEDCSCLVAPCEMYTACVKCEFSSKEGEEIPQTCEDTCGQVQLIRAVDPEKLPCREANILFSVDMANGSILVSYHVLSPASDLDICSVIVVSGVLAVVVPGIVFIVFYRIILELIFQVKFRIFQRERRRRL